MGGTAVKKFLLYIILGAVLCGLYGCNAANSSVSEECPENAESVMLSEETIESVSSESDANLEQVQPKEKDYSIPDEFVDYRKFIGEDISVLNVDTSEWDKDDFTHDLWLGTFYGHTGMIAVQLGWDDKTIVALYLDFDESDKISEEKRVELNPILQDLFGTTVEEGSVSYTYSGKEEFEFGLPKPLKQTSVCVISWNTDTMLEYMAKKPKSEITPSEEPEIIVKSDPSIGMTADEVKDSTWGSPSDINKTTTKYGVREQWVYKSSVKNRYIYLENGVVTAIQE